MVAMVPDIPEELDFHFIVSFVICSRLWQVRFFI